MSDDAWAELQAAEASARREVESRRHQSQKVLSVEQMIKRAEKKKKRGTKKKKRAANVKQLPVPRNAPDPVLEEPKEDEKPVNISEEEASLAASASRFENPEMLKRLIRRDVSRVSSVELQQRKHAMKSLLVLLFPEGAPENGENADALNEIFEDLMKPLLKQLSSSSEQCRELSTVLLQRFAAVMVDTAKFLPYFYPAIMERCSDTFCVDFENGKVVRDAEEYEASKRGKAVSMPDAGAVYKHNVKEPSEEVRLLVCKLLCTVVESLISRNLHTQLLPYLHDTIMFLHASAVDPFPALRVMALNRIASIASQERLCATMHHYCVPLIRSLMTALGHRLLKVRVACIKAIERLVMCPHRAKRKGGGSDAIVDLVGYREDNVIPICAFYGGETRINYFGKLATDNVAAVRGAFYEMLRHWTTELEDRWDHFGRLMPFVLSGVSDDDPNIQAYSLKTLDMLGSNYESEHPENIVEKRQYAVDGAQGRANYEDPYPAPWGARPRRATRLYVREHVLRFLPVVVHELSDWRSKTKSRSVGLLKTCLVYLEENITMELHAIVKCFLNRCGGEVENEILSCARLAGRFAPPPAYAALLMPSIKGEGGEGWSKRAAAARVLAAMVLGSKASTFIPSALAVIEAAACLSRGGDVASARLGARSLASACVSKLENAGSAACEAHFLQTGRLSDLGKVRACAEQIIGDEGWVLLSS